MIIPVPERAGVSNLSISPADSAASSVICVCAPVNALFTVIESQLEDIEVIVLPPFTVSPIINLLISAVLQITNRVELLTQEPLIHVTPLGL